jgi:hypothetical protein
VVLNLILKKKETEQPTNGSVERTSNENVSSVADCVTNSIGNQHDGRMQAMATSSATRAAGIAATAATSSDSDSVIILYEGMTLMSLSV